MTTGEECTMSDDARSGAESADAVPEESRTTADAIGADATTDQTEPEPIPDLVEPPQEHPSVFAPPVGGHEVRDRSAQIETGRDSTERDAAAAGSEGPVRDGPVRDEPGTPEPEAAEPVTSVQESQPTPAPAVQTVYVTAPNPPRTRGNRGIGTLLAIAATIVFAVLLALIAALYRGIAGRDGLGAAFTDWLPGFLTVPLFYVPVAVFLVLFVLFVLVVNRAGWGVYVLGSFLLAAALYFASIGILLALDGMLFNFTGHTSFASLAVNPAIVIATIVAREVAIWFGAAISSRGRRVRAKNLEAVAVYERETADTKAEIERSQYGTVS
jgi:hypothetical protein